MASKRQKPTVSPKGTAIWPKLNEPDQYDESQDPVYKVTLAFDAEKDAQSFIETIDEKCNEAFKEALEDKTAAQRKKFSMYVPYEYEEDEETGERTGRVLVKFKSKADVRDKRTGKTVRKALPIFDARASKPMKNPPRIGNGSVLKIAAVFSNPWSNPAKQAGASLYIQAVQLIELAEHGGSGGDAFGFGEEDGFETEDDSSPDFEDEGEGYEDGGDDDGDDDPDF